MVFDTSTANGIMGICDALSAGSQRIITDRSSLPIEHATVRLSDGCYLYYNARKDRFVIGKLPDLIAPEELYEKIMGKDDRNVSFYLLLKEYYQNNPAAYEVFSDVWRDLKQAGYGDVSSLSASLSVITAILERTKREIDGTKRRIKTILRKKPSIWRKFIKPFL